MPGPLAQRSIDREITSARQAVGQPAQRRQDSEPNPAAVHKHRIAALAGRSRDCTSAGGTALRYISLTSVTSRKAPFLMTSFSSISLELALRSAAQRSTSHGTAQHEGR